MTRYRWRRWPVLVAAAALLVAAALGLGLLLRQAPTQAQEALWLRQFGSADHDAATSAAADASGVVVVGWTSGALGDDRRDRTEGRLRAAVHDGG